MDVSTARSKKHLGNFLQTNVLGYTALRTQSSQFSLVSLGFSDGLKISR